jgi:Possible lysine decarboxylase
VALFPGGFGTLDEAMETLTLVQTGKRNPLPLVLVDDPTCAYWTEFIKFMEDGLLQRNYISKTDLALFERVDSIEAAIAKINRFYSRYHSMRYVNGHLVFRLTSQISEANIRTLKEHFVDILLPHGDIVQSGALPEELEDADMVSLPRLVIDFNRQDFGRLRILIDAINDF